MTIGLAMIVFSLVYLDYCFTTETQSPWNISTDNALVT